MERSNDDRPREGGVKFGRTGAASGRAGSCGKRLTPFVLGAIAAVMVAAYLFKPETQLMNTAEVRRIAERGILTVGIRTDMPGYAEDGVGLEVELASRFAEYLLPDAPETSAVQYTGVTNRTAWTKLTDGSVDVVLALMQRNGDSRFTYSYAYCADTCRVLVRDGYDENTPLETMLIGYVQDTVSATVLDEYIDAHETKAERSLLDRLLGREVELPPDAVRFTTKAFASYPDLLTALANGRIDGAALTDAYVVKYRNTDGLFLDKYRLSMHNTTLGTAEYAMAASGDEPAIVRLADMFIYEMERSGELGRLLEKYGLEPADSGAW